MTGEVSVARHEALVQRILQFIADHPGLTSSEEAFTALALEVFAWQYDQVAPYKRLCDEYGRTPATVSRWAEIPAVPAEAHKDQMLFAWRPDEAVRVFRTSGTTQGMRGSHFFRTLRLYDHAAWQSFQAMVLPDGRRDFACAFLVPSPAVMPDSSLGHMMGVVIAELGAAQRPFVLDSDGLDATHLETILTDAIAAETPVLLATTAFALARWLEDRPVEFALPPGSRVMETGGFKGHRTSYDPETLRTAIVERLGVPVSHIVSEYGMTELSSQCYTGNLRAAVLDEDATTGFIAPPWMRVQVVDPETGLGLPTGEAGLIQLMDLANLDGLATIYTADQGRVTPEGTLELLGRLPGAEQRGCSLTAAEILGEGLVEDEWSLLEGDDEEEEESVDMTGD